MEWEMITIVESRNIVTRLCIGCDGPAQNALMALRDLMRGKGWLAVTLSRVPQQPQRSHEELERVRAIMNLIKL